MLEGLSAGAWGVVHEMALAQRCWGFRLQDIQVPHAFLWHGLQVGGWQPSSQQRFLRPLGQGAGVVVLFSQRLWCRYHARGGIPKL